MKYLTFLIAMCSLTFGQSYTDVFTLCWGNGDGELGLEIERLGGVSHEKGYFTLRYGPQSLAVSADQAEIAIFDRPRDRVAVFDPRGKFLRSHPVASGLSGLAMAKDKTMVAFSPEEKYAEGISGKLAGRRMDAPVDFSALSEVWFTGEELWGRYGWMAARMDIPQDRTTSSFSHALLLEDGSVGIMGGSRYAVLAMDRPLCNCYASGQPLADGRMLLTMVLSGEESYLEIVACDADGNASRPIALSRPWTSCFSTYSAVPDGTVYEMVIRENGVTVRRWDPPEPDRSWKIRDIPAQDVLPETDGSTERRNVNVWFRDANVVRTLDLEDYIKGVVSQEIFGTWQLETHKAMAIAARTYAVARYRHPGTNPPAHVCNTTCCQAWTAHPTPKAIDAVNATAGVYIYSGSSVVKEALYFSHCNGHTRNSEDYDSWNFIAYLRSRPCNCGWTWYYGHGVGMCQYGMEACAKNGMKYGEIIQHYYTGCTAHK